MNYRLIKDVLNLLEAFEKSGVADSQSSIEEFKHWIVANHRPADLFDEPDWEGKMAGRTSESVIASMIVHMNRFGKNYFKSAILGSEFSTQDDVIYLIVLRFSKDMTKMDLIKKNVHEKPAGMQIINRLINNGWVEQVDSETDKRSKILHITPHGIAALDGIMDKVRKATDIVCGDLTHHEKLELIRLLHKLNDYHLVIYNRNIAASDLLYEAGLNMGHN